MKKIFDYAYISFGNSFILLRKHFISGYIFRKLYYFIRTFYHSDIYMKLKIFYFIRKLFY